MVCSMHVRTPRVTVSDREPATERIPSADASAERWRAGRALSSIDGMPIGIKDLLETKDMPTEMGCEAYRGNFPKRDNAAVWALRLAGAVPFAKTVTAELGGSYPGATRNPFGLDRTPGGSSSGSAAAVAAVAAVGVQVVVAADVDDVDTSAKGQQWQQRWSQQQQ